MAGKKPESADATKAWFRKLSKEEKQQVFRWLGHHRPPSDFPGSNIDYAYLEMPTGIFSKRPGRIL